jgi:hypothetical protein
MSTVRLPSLGVAIYESEVGNKHKAHIDYLTIRPDTVLTLTSFKSILLEESHVIIPQL